MITMRVTAVVLMLAILFSMGFHHWVAEIKMQMILGGGCYRNNASRTEAAMAYVKYSFTFG